MESNDIVSALSRFFLDIIGSVIPGLTFVLGLCAVFALPYSIGPVTLLPITTFADGLIVAIIGYIAGYAISSIGENIVEGKIRKRHKDTLLNTISSDATYKAFEKKASGIYSPPTGGSFGFTAWRNIAMSIAPENSALVYRFMFISLFNLGMGTTCWLLVAALVIRFFISMVQPPLSIDDGVAAIVLFVVSWLFLERRSQFFKRAMLTPFSMALVKLQQPETNMRLELTVPNKTA